VTRKRPALFRGRHFEDVIILLCVRWYLRYSLTYRDLEELYCPIALLVVTRQKFLATFTAVTVAVATAAPVLAVTEPEMIALPS